MASDFERYRQQAVHDRDSETDSPELRSTKVLELLHGKVTEWDMLCFAVNYIGYMSTTYPWLKPVASRACSLVYNAHYLDERTQSEIDATEKVSSDGHNEQNDLSVERTNDSPISLHISSTSREDKRKN